MGRKPIEDHSATTRQNKNRRRYRRRAAIPLMRGVKAPLSTAPLLFTYGRKPGDASKVKGTLFNCRVITAPALRANWLRARFRCDGGNKGAELLDEIPSPDVCFEKGEKRGSLVGLLSPFGSESLLFQRGKWVEKASVSHPLAS